MSFNTKAGFTPEVLAALDADPSLSGRIAHELLDAHFPDSVHAEILSAVGLNVGTFTSRRRKRDATFRPRILVAYDFRCCVCGFDACLGTVPIALDAAHIRRHQAGGPDVEGNGMALCALHHKTFDLGAFTIDPGLVVLVSDKLEGTEPDERAVQGHRVADGNRKFTELYNVQRLTSNTIMDSSRVVISTIQRVYSMLKGEPDLDPAVEEGSQFEMSGAAIKEPLPVVYDANYPPEHFDVLVIDEVHRSIYTLWRQVVEYFDAFLVDLTATPSKQTLGFFNKNLVMEYDHERAVADGVNVDFEVYNIRTKITERGATVEARPDTMLGYRDRHPAGLPPALRLLLGRRSDHLRHLGSRRRDPSLQVSGESREGRHDRPEAERFWNFPREAIEEAIANAVYHRDYLIREPVEVRITPDDLVVLSFPGPDRSLRPEDLRAGRAVNLVTDRDTGRPRGFAFVEMSLEAEAQAAIDGLNEKSLGGRNLTVNIAKPRENRGGGNGGGRSGGHRGW